MNEDALIPNRRLGADGPEVFPIALGCMSMTGMYGPADTSESLATIHEALDRGVNLLDTGDFYDIGRNEMLIGRALKERTDKPLLSVKFGALRGPDGGWTGIDGRPVAVKNALAHSLSRLGVDHVDVYRIARLDPKVPIEDTIGAISQMVKAGYVRQIGLSEVGPDTIRRAHAVHPISDLQIEYSLISRRPEDGIFPVLEELGISVTAYGVLSRGLLSGSVPAGKSDYRDHLPRFSGDNLARNQRLAAELQRLAADKGLTASQLAIAWALAKGPRIIPLIGARKRSQLRDSLGALTIRLSAEEIHHLEETISPAAAAGTRYDAFQMKHLDSEKR